VLFISRWLDVGSFDQPGNLAGLFVRSYNYGLTRYVPLRTRDEVRRRGCEDTEATRITHALAIERNSQAVK
jgi:hypothetical protein